jgi:hypothetical protein
VNREVFMIHLIDVQRRTRARLHVRRE